MKMQTLTARVQYDDLLGTVAADHHDTYQWDDLARECGVDTGRYFVFGVNVHYNMENRDDKTAMLQVDILTVDTQVVGASFDQIRDFLQKNDGKLPYIKFRNLASFQQILSTFKRFDMVLTMKVGPIQNAVEEDCVDLGRLP